MKKTGRTKQIDTNEKIQNYSCIFLNMELNVNNINSNQEHLGKIPRYYETETLRLIKSIRNISSLKDISIYLILFRPYESYDKDIISKLNDLQVTFLIPKIKNTTKKIIDNFKSGFWYIPLSGYLIENTKKIIHSNKTKESSHLVKLDNTLPDLPEFGLKLDSDMVMIKNPFNFKDIIYNYDIPVVGQYDKDSGDDCKERLKYGIYDAPNNLPMSNTCLIFSNLNEDVYSKWWQYLIVNDDNYCDLFEEVSFDIVHPIPKGAQGFKNFQVGENYLCAKDLSAEELQDIYFYHGKLLDPKDINQKLELVTRVSMYQRLDKKYKN